MRRKGNNAILALGIMFISIIFGSFAVDIGTYATMHSQMQAAADAASLAGVLELFKTQTGSASQRLSNAKSKSVNYAQLNWNNRITVSDVDVGYVNPTTQQYDPGTFNTQNMVAFPETNGYNAIRVRVVRNETSTMGPIPTTFAHSMGIDGMNSTAEAVSMFPGQPSAVTGGLRPFFLCQAAYDIALKDYNDSTIPEITFYGDNFMVGNKKYMVSNYCPCKSSGNNNKPCSNPPGSWGLVNFLNNNGAPGISQVRDWIRDGYDGTVSKGQVLNPQTGTGLSSASSELSGLVSSQEVFTMPVYSGSSQQGQNAQFNTTGLVSFQLTGYDLSGNNSYLRGHFAKKVCKANCSYSASTQGDGLESLTMVRLVH